MDTNECTLPGLNPCSGLAQCVNTPGSFYCQCPTGYSLDITGRDCRDVNECRELNICSNGDCTNIAGSFQCSCRPGFTLTTNKDQCVEIDECSRSPGICGNGTCINSLGSHSCRCNPGFTVGSKGDCEDIDECRTGPSMFQLCRNGRCRNTVGGVTCDCPTGYELTLDGRNCRDTDECSDPSLCLPPGKCQNMLGSYLCSCPRGYELDSSGTRCVDINECLVDLSLCSAGFCQNTEGGFQCQCEAGWELNSSGEDCEDRREAPCYSEYRAGYCLAPLAANMPRQSCCCTLGRAWGGQPCQSCPPDSSQEFNQLCPQGRGRGGSGGTSRDFNECEMMENLCEGGDCINTDGSFRCQCPPGYKLDSTGRRCEDQDECETFNFCGNGTCSNLRGGFQCDCSPGYGPGRDGRCEDLNECLDPSQGHQCAFRCHNTVGSYRCVCPYGYELASDGRHCKGQ